MTGDRARVAAVWTRQGAGLLAAAFCQAVAPVADPFAAVHLARQQFTARQAARNVLQMTWDVAALLVLPHAPLLSQVGAGWTLLLTVAVVKHWVVALVSSRTQVFALRGLGAAGDGRVQHGEPAVTRQLVKTGLPTGFTVSTVTRILAAVEATVELVAADQRALVLHNHTAELATFVSATGAFLAAAPLAGEDELLLSLDCCTWDLLSLGATSASDSRGQQAGTTAALMAQILTQMDGVTGATGQGFVARLSTGRDGIRAALSFRVAQFQEFGEWRLTTGTGLHQGRGAWARLAWAAMAHFLAPVGFTTQHLSTCFLTGEMSRTIKSFFISSAQNFTSCYSAVANLLKLQLAGLTCPTVAHLCAGVFSTVEDSAAHFITLEHCSLAAAHWLTCLLTCAGFCDKGGTLGTRSRVTQDVTRVVAIHSTSFLATHVTTAVRNLCALPLRVCHFTTEAGVGSRLFQYDMLAGRTSPAFS